MNRVDDLVTGAMGKADRLNAFFALVITRKVFQALSSVKALEEEENAQHRMRTGPIWLHSRLFRDLADVLPRPLSIISQSL